MSSNNIFKSLRFLASLVFLFPVLLLGQTDYQIPALGKAGSANSSVVVKSIKSDYRIIGSGFKLVIPKGWTLNPAGESDMFLNSFNTHPTEQIETDPVYLSIHQRKTEIDLKKFKASQLTKGHSAKEVNNANFDSVQAEYVGKDSKAQDVQNFLWIVKSKSAYFVVMAGAPISDKQKIETLRTILRTLIFK